MALAQPQIHDGDQPATGMHTPKTDVRGSGAGGKIAVVLKGYPRLSETFIAQELLGLEQRGWRLHIVSLRKPYDPVTHPIHSEIVAPVSYLPEYLWREPVRVLRAWWRARRLPGYRGAARKFRRDLWRDFSPNRIRRFGQACVMASELDAQMTLIYAHFLHTPTSVTRYAATMTGLPFAVSAHAKDIWTTPDWEIREKIDDASWLTTCTAHAVEYLRDLVGAHHLKDKIHLNYHGLDLERFAPIETARRLNTGDDTQQPIVLASVGRLVEKKGYDDLLDALALLPAGLSWRLVHIGGGPLERRLRAQATALAIGDRIEWQGRQPQEEVKALLQRADLFILASKIADDGDRDGLPNVLMEAQSQSLPCIATAVSAIPELIEDGVTGRLVAAGDAKALAKAITELAGDPSLRQRFADAALIQLQANFEMDSGHNAIAGLIASSSVGAHSVAP